MRARPVTAFALTRYAHAQPVPRSPAGDPHLAWAHENGLVGRERINRSDEAGDFTGLTQPTRNLFRTARVYREWARELSEMDATWEAFDVKDYVKTHFDNVEYSDLLFPGPHGPKSITKTAWVVPIASQTASTGTLADSPHARRDGHRGGSRRGGRRQRRGGRAGRQRARRRRS